MKKDFPRKTALLLAFCGIACTACASFGNSGLATPVGGNSMALSHNTRSTDDHYGNDYSVRQAIGSVKTHGTERHVSSRAIRLPERPLGEVTVFSFEFPAHCGGHTFRVIEADDTQILEFAYIESSGGSNQVRDYVSGTSPFVQPGLWTAYDHTASSISTMTSKFDRGGSGMVNGAYSQGLVTNLPAMQQRELGSAYQRALSDVGSCRDI